MSDWPGGNLGPFFIRQRRPNLPVWPLVLIWGALPPILRIPPRYFQKEERALEGQRAKRAPFGSSRHLPTQKGGGWARPQECERRGFGAVAFIGYAPLMTENKTQPTGASVRDFLSSVDHPGRREDAMQLLNIFTEVTGFEAVMWGSSIIGFGRYHYTYASGRTGDFLATGFSPRKANMSVYIMPGYADYGSILERLGPHKKGVSCLYLGRVSKVDLDVLRELIVAGVSDLNKIWTVHPK